MDADVVVIGGGVAGIAAATGLADAGLRVTLLERSRQTGGRARSWTDARTGDAIDIGRHARGRRLAARQADDPRDFSPASRGASCAAAYAVQPASGSGARRPILHADLVSNSRPTWAALRWREDDVAHLDDVSGLDYLVASGVTRHVIEWFWAFATLSVLNVPLERCSAAALLRVHGQLLGYRRIHFGFPAVALGELFTWKNGAAPYRSLLGAAVMDIERSDGAFVAVHLGDGTRMTARHCIVAVPPPEPESLVPQLVDTTAFEPSRYISCYLWFDRKLTSERFWAQLGALQRLNTDFYDLSNIRSGWSQRPSLIASNIIYSHRANALPDDEIIDATRGEIAQFAPAAREAELRHAAVNRIPMAIACPSPGSEKRRPASRTAVRGLFLAGDWTRTGLPSSMEGAARSGFLAAEAVLAAMGRPRSLAKALRRKDGLAGLATLGRGPGRASGIRPRARPGRRP